ncbi:MAG: hypothetical protein GX557_14230 [Chloroflexi bacterium]|nr:hypothetical protein [Chloroflexota bacterium]
MAFSHGSAGYLKLGDTDISAYVESSDLNLTRESADIKVYGAAWVARVMGIISAALNAACAYDPTLDAAIWTALTGSAAVAFEWGPQGNGDGAVKYSGNVWISSSAISAPSTGKATQNLVCQPTGEIMKGAFSA